MTTIPPDRDDETARRQAEDVREGHGDHVVADDSTTTSSGWTPGEESSFRSDTERLLSEGYVSDRRVEADPELERLLRLEAEELEAHERDVREGHGDRTEPR